MVQVRGFLLACPSPLPLGAAVLSTPVSCMQLSALLFFAHKRGNRRRSTPEQRVGKKSGTSQWLDCQYTGSREGVRVKGGEKVALSPISIHSPVLSFAWARESRKVRYRLPVIRTVGT